MRAHTLQTDSQMRLVLKFPEVLATDGAQGTNKFRRVLQLVLATCADLVRRPVCVAVLPGETIKAVGFVYLALQFLLKLKYGPGRLVGNKLLVSDQAPATVHVHRQLAAAKSESAFGGADFTPYAVSLCRSCTLFFLWQLHCACIIVAGGSDCIAAATTTTMRNVGDFLAD